MHWISLGNLCRMPTTLSSLVQVREQLEDTNNQHKQSTGHEHVVGQSRIIPLFFPQHAPSLDEEVQLEYSSTM